MKPELLLLLVATCFASPVSAAMDDILCPNDPNNPDDCWHMCDTWNFEGICTDTDYCYCIDRPSTKKPMTEPAGPGPTEPPGISTEPIIEPGVEPTTLESNPGLGPVTEPGTPIEPFPEPNPEPEPEPEPVWPWFSGRTKRPRFKLSIRAHAHSNFGFREKLVKPVTYSY